MNNSDKKAFLDSLKIYDRPEKDLRTRCLEAEDDVDALVEELFSRNFTAG